MSILGISFAQWNVWNVIIRIMVSAVLGALIGIDRGVKRRGGGARTTMTVSLGATMVMLTEQYFQVNFPDQGDMTRMAAQVISGVGFLGVGTIMVSGHKVKGLTSAASTWTCASIGLAAGIGFIDGAVLLTAVLLVGLHIVPRIEDRFYRHTKYLSLYIEIDHGKAISGLMRKMKEDGCMVDSFEVEKPKIKGQNYTIMTVIRTPRKTNTDEYMNDLREMKGVVYIDEM